MEKVIQVDHNDVTIAIRHLLAQLLETGIVEALFVPLKSSDGTLIPALVTDSDLLETVDPLTPLMPINSARAVSALTSENHAMRLGAVLRPCEIRALVELVKLKQASLEGVTLIGIDCLGTCELADYQAAFARNGRGQVNLAPEVLQAAQTGSEPDFGGAGLRPACQVCVTAVPEMVGIHVHLFGVDTRQGLPVTLAEEIAGKLDLSGGNDAIRWDSEKAKMAAGEFLAKRQVKRSQELDAMRKQMNAKAGIASLFSACIRCHNCMTACPICYCKTCLFKTPFFDHEPAFYLASARRKGAQRMLGDTLLFHLTRLNHMSTSCVSCGMCSSACPSDIPVGMIFSAVAEQVQAAFEYIPGRSASEPLPLITFQADEWSNVGEDK